MGSSTSRRYVGYVLRFGVAAAGIAYICWQLNWTDHVDAQGGFHPGVGTTLREAQLPYLILGLLTVALIYPIQSLRWWLLLRARELSVPLWQCFRLVMVGTFFNYCMPGTTGGDVVRAYYAARHAHRRTDTVISIIVDRISGLLGLVVLAGIAGLFMLQDRVILWLTGFVWLGLLGFAAASMCYFSSRIRTLMRVEKIISMLPGRRLIQAVDNAAMAYSQHKAAVLLTVAISVVVHLCLSMSTAVSGYALGLEAPVMLLLTVIPVAFLVAAMPISYQGAGTMDAVALALLLHSPFANANANQIITMLVLIRLYQVVYGLLGSLFLLSGDIHVRSAQAVEMDFTADADAARDTASDAEPDAPSQPQTTP